MSSFNVKTAHAVQQMDYGVRHGYDTLILSISKNDPSDGKYLSSMDLRRALEYLQRKVNKFVFVSNRLTSFDFESSAIDRV